MPLLDLHKLTVGLSRTWAGYLRGRRPRWAARDHGSTRDT